MGSKTRIEWSESTWTPIRARSKATGKVGWHCTHLSEGCRNCYAEGLNKRLGTGLAYKPGHAADIEVFLDEKMLLQPLRWRRPRMIFVGSMTDLFADFVTDAMLDRIFAVMALCPHHTFQLLTKRPERMREYLTTPHRPGTGKFITITDDGRQFETPGAHIRAHSAMCDILPLAPAQALNDACAWQDERYPDGDGFLRKWPLPNVWLGTSCEDQATADLRVPELLATPAAIRFVSAEPLLGPINLDLITLRRDGEHPTPLSNKLGDYVQPLRGNFTDSPRLDWIIVGGESGAHARPFDIDWARSIVNQGEAAGTAVYVKQLGSLPHSDGRPMHAAPRGKYGDPAEWPADLRVREMPRAA